jgi:hypothetical protein
MQMRPIAFASSTARRFKIGSVFFLLGVSKPFLGRFTGQSKRV